MVALAALIGWIAGYVLHRAGDILPRAAGRSTTLVWTPGVWRFAGALLRRHASRPWARRDAVIECLTAAAFALLWARWQLRSESVLLGGAYLFFLLVALIDLKYQLVLNVLMYPAIGAALIVTIIAAPDRLLPALLGGTLSFSIFVATSLLRPGSLGGGDVKLAALIGLGFGFPQLLWVLLIGAGLGAVTAVGLPILGRGAAGRFIPYAPFLCVGAVAYLLISLTPLLPR